MPFDGKTKLRAEDLTVDGLASWLETMPAAGEYNYYDCFGACLIGQYMAACGMPWRDNDLSNYIRVSEALTTIAAAKPRTFGAALERARARAAKAR